MRALRAANVRPRPLIESKVRRSLVLACSTEAR